MSKTTPDLEADEAITALMPVLQRLRSFAAGLVIKSEEGFQAAASRLKEIKGALAQIEDARTRITKPLNESLRETNAQAKAAAAPFLADEIVIKNAMIRYSNEQDRIRQEEQRRANEAAEKERRRLQAIADETARKAREEAEKKRREAEAAAAAGRQAEADRLRAAASRVEEKAAEKSELFENRASQVVAPIATQEAPKVAGISVPKVWTFDIIDPMAIPREFLIVDETRIRKVVQAMKGSTNIPGVRVSEVKRIAAATA
jgi:uncharacterized membrane protein YqiK